jgi:hypothetical protein
MAKLHELPPLPGTQQSENDEVAPNVDITVLAGLPDHRQSKRLNVRVKNVGSEVFEITGAELKWEYDPPRWGEKLAGKPQVAEAGGSITFRAATVGCQVPPDSETVMWIDAFDSPVLVALLADDVPDDKIEIKVYTKTGFVFKVFGEEVPSVVREVARNALEHEHRR